MEAYPQAVVSCNGDFASIKAAEQSGHFFEGAEKLFEIWFDKDASPNAHCQGLRAIPYDEVVELLEIAECHILHFRTNGILDSYVLSESSMFVSENRIILKTCGSTKLLHSIDRMLDLAKRYANMDTVANVYYSRKNFLRPELQSFVHQNFDSETALLDHHFEEGVAYCMGSLKQHRWYLYTLEMPQSPPCHPDHTLEICMNNIPSDVLKVFSKDFCATGEECTKISGIDQLCPAGTIIHEELFDPVGYSMNGILPNSDQYITIHITPEPDFCYASFETNQQKECLYEQTLKVLRCFQPIDFLLTVFANDESEGGSKTQLMLWNQELPGYKRTSLQFVRLQYDTLVYAQFTRRDLLNLSPKSIKNSKKPRRLVACHGSDTEDESTR